MKRFLIIDDFGHIGPKDNQLPKKAVNEASANTPEAAVQSLLPLMMVLEVEPTNHPNVTRVRGGDLLIVTVVQID